MPKTNIYRTALAADATLNVLGRDIIDVELNACEVILLDAYEHVPTSLDDIASKMDTVLAIEDVEPVIRVALETTRDGARQMAAGMEMVRDALNALGRDPTNDKAKACAETILDACSSFPELFDVVVAFALAILAFDKDMEAATRIVLGALRDGAKKLVQ